MGVGGGGRTALSLFRFHLFPFPPETPDTQASSSTTPSDQLHLTLGFRVQCENGYNDLLDGTRFLPLLPSNPDSTLLRRAY